MKWMFPFKNFFVCIDSNCPVIPLPSAFGGYKKLPREQSKCWLWTQVYGLEIVCHKVSLSSFGNYSTPSISVGRKTAVWQLEVIISASPRPLTIPCVSPSMRQMTAPIFIIVKLLFMSFVGVKVHRSLRQSKQEKKIFELPVAPSPLQALTTRQLFGIFYHLFSAESL